MREAAVTMAAVLGSFGTALAIRNAADLSTSVVILAVALALTMGRHSQRAERRGPTARLLRLLVLPLFAVGANEIGLQIFRHPDFGDALFVVAVSATIWARRLGPLARQLVTLATFPLIAMLIVPAPVVSLDGNGGDTRWWSALIAIVALGWVGATRALATQTGVIAAEPSHPTRSPVPARPAGGAGQRARPGSKLSAQTESTKAPVKVRRMAASDKMAIQMAVALGAAFAVGRGLFGAHWTWVVLTAFIVCSGNRGRGDVVYKAVLRLVGACSGTLVATLLTGVFAPGDNWAIVLIFVVLAVALWLRAINYAYWAAGMTAALALLYGYYGDGGIGLLGNRLEGILAGAVIAVAASWILWPVRTTDVLRRDTALALAALDGYIASLGQDLTSVLGRQHEFQHAAKALTQTGAPLRAAPPAVRARVPYLAVVKAIERCASELPSITAVVEEHGPGSHAHEHLSRLRGGIREMRKANGQRVPPDGEACDQLLDRIRELKQRPEVGDPEPFPTLTP